MIVDGFQQPAYGDRSLADVLPAVSWALGVGDRLGTAPTGLRLPEARRYVVFLVDGLGHELLRRHADCAPYLSSLIGSSEPATVGVPSTTATSLTSLGVGAPPGVHGVLGFTTRIPGTDLLLNALKWSKDVDPVQWQAQPTAFTRLAAAGVATTVVNKREFAGTGLTVASCRGADYVRADRLGERLVAVQAAVSAEPSLTYTYDGDLDWTGHRYGVDSPQWRAQLSMIDVATERLREALPSDVRLVVVADHGMVDVGPDDRVDVDERPELREGVALLGGEARFRHLYCRAGAVDDVLASWRAVLGDDAVVTTREEALGADWFGPTSTDLRPRIGDVVVACRGTRGVLSSAAFPLETRLIGMHGSLTPEEMLIPVLVS